MIISYAMPPVVVGAIWLFLLDPSLGMITHYLLAFGIIDQPIYWFSENLWAKWMITLVASWTFWPFMFLIILSSLQSIPESHYELAEIYGANLWQRFVTVTWPNIRGAILVDLCQLSYGGSSSPDWTRTSNLPVNSRLLCQLSYRGLPRCIERTYLGIRQGACARCDTYISASRGVLRQSVRPGRSRCPRVGRQHRQQGKGGRHALPAHVRRRTGPRLRARHAGRARALRAAEEVRAAGRPEPRRAQHRGVRRAAAAAQFAGQGATTR